MFVTAVCVVFLIKLRWLKDKSIYDIAQLRSVVHVFLSCSLALSDSYY